MTYFVDTTDERNKIVKKLLSDNKKQTEIFSDQKIHNIEIGDVVIFSPAKKWTFEEAQTMPAKISIFGGKISKDLQENFISKDIAYHNLLDDEIFAIKNANLTAEGVLSLIIEHSPNSIFENNVLILGAGRISKALSIYLGRLGVKNAMVRYNEQKFPECFTFTDKCYFGDSFVKDLKDFDIIVNTIPQVIFDHEKLLKIAPDTIYIETASINSLDKDKAIHFKFVHAPALPQRFSKNTAAKFMYQTILGENNYV